MTDEMPDEDEIYFDGSDAYVAARHKHCVRYTRTELVIRKDDARLDAFERVLRDMADQWTVEEIKANYKYESCDFEEGYNTFVKKSRNALAQLQKLRGG